MPKRPNQTQVKQSVAGASSRVEHDDSVGEVIDDPEHLLTWPSKDRALLSFKSEIDFQARREAFQSIIRQCAA